MYCPHCGQEHSDRMKYCPITGEPLSPSLVICQNCEMEVKIGLSFCPFCGFSFAEDPLEIRTETTEKLSAVQESTLKSLLLIVFVILLIGGVGAIILGTVLIWSDQPLDRMPVNLSNATVSPSQVLQSQATTSPTQEQIVETILPTTTSTLTSTLTREPPPTPMPTEATPTILPPSVTDEFGVNMVLVPAGSFEMGSSADVGMATCKQLYVDGECIRADYLDEEPIHSVTLDDFYLDTYEVTNAQYANCVAEGVCNPPTKTSSFTSDLYYGDPKYNRYPVIYVRWEDANTYCSWRDARLPTEAEWEKAARGTERSIYPWGNDFDGEIANFCDKNCFSDWANEMYNDGFGDTAPVGEYPAGVSPYDVMDLAGNVWEWVADWYSLNYYQDSPFENPAGPSYGEKRVLRGGAWNANGSILRTTTRFPENPDGSFFNVGFRCAKPASEFLTAELLSDKIQVPTQQLTQTASAETTMTPTIESDSTEIPTTIVDEKNISMVFVPPGSFEMGGDAAVSLTECVELNVGGNCTRSWFEDQEPIHTITLEAYFIDQFEVTNSNYAECVNTGTCKLPSDVENFKVNNYFLNPNYTDFPVVNVTWSDARMYCSWRGIRLPTEAEWEKAAHGNTRRLYPWGDTFDGSKLNFCDINCDRDYAHPNFDDGYATTAPVGSYTKAGSPYGAYDMAGNVWEWVADWYDIYPSGNQNASQYFGQVFRVLRGGAWNYSGFFASTVHRFYRDPTDARPFIGFRCAKTP